MALTPPIEKIVWSRPTDLPDIEILHAEDSRRPWHVYHTTYTICTILEHGGLTEWDYRRRHHYLYKQQVMLMEPGEYHSATRHTAHGTFYVLQVKPALVESLAREAGLKGRPHFKIATAVAPSLFHACAHLHASLDRGGPLLERQSLLADTLGQLLAECSETGLRDAAPPAWSTLRRTRDYLHAHYAEAISLEALARIAGLSRFHFLRAFARQFGLPPHAYQISLRVEKTRDLLKAGVPVGEIEAGFADQSHLTRHFKRVMGVTPGQYAATAGPHNVALGGVA